MKPDIHSAINAITKGSTAFGIKNGIIDGWDLCDIKSNVTQPTKEAIQAELDSQNVEWTAQAYARDREPAYPSVGDQLDMLMKDMKDGTTTHQTACEAVKAKYPKP